MAVTQSNRAGAGLDAWRASLRAVIETPGWERAITAIIVLNAVTLGLETSATVMRQFGPLLYFIDNAILAVFVVEIAVRVFVYGRAFWRDPWSLFDVFIVGVALLPATGSFSVLRALRVIRVLRLISTVKSMRRVVSGLLSAIPSMGAVIALLALIFYVFSVMATKLYGTHYPQLFGTIGTSAFSLFQVMTLEGWAAEIVRPVMEKHPRAWIFFIVFILVTSFAVLNLFIGIIVDSMQREHEAELKDDRIRSEATFDEILAEMRALRREMEALRGARLAVDNPQQELKLAPDST
jgi:voltage-gated sodium channel